MSLVLMISLSSAGLKASTLSLKEDSSDGKADTMTKAKAMNKKACNALIENKLLELNLVTCHTFTTFDCTYKDDEFHFGLVRFDLRL